MLHYKTIGNDPDRSWLVMIHGAGGSVETWFRQVPDFSRHFNLLLVDLAGHGDSQDGITKESFTFEFMADQIIEVLDHLKIEKAHFISLSIGCIVAQVIAANYPERIKKMVMAGAITALNFKTKMIIHLAYIFRYTPQRIMTWLLVKGILPQKNTNRIYMKSARKVTTNSFLLWMSILIKVESLISKLYNTKCEIPTLYLMGEKDILFLSTAERSAKRNKEYSTFMVVPNAGHVCNIDNKAFFNKASIDYLLA